MRILIVGAARQGTSLARFLSAQGADVVLNDNRQSSQLEEAQRQLADCAVHWVFGEHPLSLLDQTDLVCPSGGVPLELPLITEASRRGIELSNDSQIFLEQVAGKTIGLTGSAGKTTTTTLVGRILLAEAGADYKVWVGGNIGNPLIDVVDEIRENDLSVMELSSFQLDLMTRSPEFAAVLNITPNHLDRHGTMEAYTAAKANILRYQSSNDVAVLGRDDLGAWKLSDFVKGQLITFGMHPPAHLPLLDVHVRAGTVVIQRGRNIDEVMPTSNIELRGTHNLLNILAACAITAAVGARPEAMRAGVQGFSGIPHRLEFVRRWNGADWYNDSIATAPERAIAGLQAFDEPLILLAGGRDKDLSWDVFADQISEKVDHLVAFGEIAEMLAQKVRTASGDRPKTILSCAGLRDAVKAAARLVSPGYIVLLSPGGTSFDEFEDFAKRGERFKEWVLELT